MTLKCESASSMLKHMPGCLFDNKISFVRGLNFRLCWKLLALPCKCWMRFLFSHVNDALMAQAQAVVVYEPHGKVREAARNAMKPIIFLTARHTPHRGVKQARWVQDQCESKRYPSSLTAWPHPSVLLCWRAMRHRGPARTSEDPLMLFLLWKGALLWDVEKTC